jgi:hypothetical protein
MSVTGVRPNPVFAVLAVNDDDGAPDAVDSDLVDWPS